MDYPQFTAVEVHHAGRWHAAGDLRVVNAGQGVFSYRDEYVFGPLQRPVSLTQPVGIEPAPLVDGPLGLQPDWRLPAFLYDLVPQGRGRRYLLERLRLPDSYGIEAALLLRGAFNPIGALRLSSAVAFYEEEARKAGPAQAQVLAGGFSLDDMAARSEDFVEHLALHSMLASGTTGVQGVAPKFLLATDAQGHWFADMALADADACGHWLAKLPRGRTPDDLTVHRNEAAYLRLAAACGIRSNGVPPRMVGNMLLVRRFDRVVHQGVLHRLHQESAASLYGLRGFGLPARQQDLLAAIRSVVDDPARETLEFLRRDVLNQALRNTDNHARNTAVQRTVEGVVQLTPLFDFSPMFLDPDLIARTCHWQTAAGKLLPDWAAVVDTLPVADDTERAAIARALVEFADVVQRLPALARDAGVDEAVIEQCRRSIDRQAAQLLALAPRGEAHRHA